MSTPPTTSTELQPQINLEQLSQGALTVATELSRLGSLPQIGGASAILQRLDTMQSSINDRFSALDTKVTALDTKVAALDTKVAALDAKVTTFTLQTTANTHNAAARLYNRQIDRAEHRLRPLHHALSNENIPGFPATAADIEGLQSRPLRDMLTALGEDSDGTPAERRHAFRCAIGMKQRTV